jgi:hypothetical protein
MLYMKISCLNTDPYCATDANVAVEYLHRMIASCYRVLKSDVKWLVTNYKKFSKLYKNVCFFYYS